MSLLLGNEPREWLEIEMSVRKHYRDSLVYEARLPEDDPRIPEHGSLAGYMHLSFTALPGDPEASTHLHMIAVNPSYDRRGVGRRLMTLLVELAGGPDRVTYTGLTPEGALLWQAVTGRVVEPTLPVGTRTLAGWRDA